VLVVGDADQRLKGPQELRAGMLVRKDCNAEEKGEGGSVARLPDRPRAVRRPLAWTDGHHVTRQNPT
jgi:hypothetical protein